MVSDISHYIHFYNTQPYQAKLNNPTPLEFRNQVALFRMIRRLRLLY
ncbi:IS3 family transposase [Streptococcus ratti]